MKLTEINYMLLTYNLLIFRVIQHGRLYISAQKWLQRSDLYSNWAKIWCNNSWELVSTHTYWQIEWDLFKIWFTDEMIIF